MASSANAISSLTYMGFPKLAIRRHHQLGDFFLMPQYWKCPQAKGCSFRMTISQICSQHRPIFIASASGPLPGKLPKLNSVSDDVDAMSEDLFEAIEELERMARDPSDILEEMNHRLSSRELQLVLVYFSQEGRDSWCALEVFEWLKKENRVDQETMELMVTIMCGWIRKLIEGEHEVEDVVDLLVDMECVGLKPSFSMIEKVITLYWEAGNKERAVLFVKQVLKREVAYDQDRAGDAYPRGPTGYLIWKMMVDGDYKDAADLIISFRESGLKPDTYSYIISMTALVKELIEFAKALRKLKGYSKAGLISILDKENIELMEKYQSDLIANGVRISKWSLQEGSPSLYGIVHERLLAMYICAGRGLEAEQQLWEMKLVGKEADDDLHDVVLAICASQKEVNAVQRLLTRVEMKNSMRKKTLVWLLRGYIKGGHFEEASETLVKMLDMGMYPEYLNRAAVFQGLRNRIRNSGDVDIYLSLCRRLSGANLIGPCLVYLYIKKCKLWIMRMM